ncbi:hypothetical protein VNI00_013922 [Paramarasmius palmivorus]|uniref:Uncharacterized protein n=1 Tax=Paramarasmius palmivorus TaxID=297713 RepID=A0AAW0BX28_9AGAR
MPGLCYVSAFPILPSVISKTVRVSERAAKCGRTSILRASNVAEAPFTYKLEVLLRRLSQARSGKDCQFCNGVHCDDSSMAPSRTYPPCTNTLFKVLETKKTQFSWMDEGSAGKRFSRMRSQKSRLLRTRLGACAQGTRDVGAILVDLKLGSSTSKNDVSIISAIFGSQEALMLASCWR